MRIVPCSSRIFSTGAFNAPQKGDRIEQHSKPGDYMLVTERPETNTDASGQTFWTTRVMDQAGQERFISSDEIKSWQHFKGQNYNWHDELIEKKKYDKQQKEQASIIEQFEAENVFPNGRPLRTHPSRPLIVKVIENASGSLELFAGEKISVKNIEYQSNTLYLEPVDPELVSDPMFAESIKNVPVSELMANVEPIMNDNIAKEKVRIPIRDNDGNETGKYETITSEELLQLTPNLNILASRGQIEIKANVYVNYIRGDNQGGEGVFQQMLLDRGADPETTTYYKNTTERKELDDGSFSPRYAWTGEIIIYPPVSEEVIDEASKIAPKSQVKLLRNGGVRIYSNSLYKNMISLGVLESNATV